jgi:hypothetical protein
MRANAAMLCLATLLPALAAAPALAQSSGDSAAPSKGGGGQLIRQRFEKADTNGDGKLSKAEAKAGMPMVYRNFDAIDTNQDGFITPEELRAAMQKRREQTQGKGGTGTQNTGSGSGTTSKDNMDDVDNIPK